VSGQSRSPTVEAPSQTPSVDAPTQGVAPAQAGPAEAGAGNAAEQEKLRGKEGTTEGLANYQAVLGQWLGGELYKAVAPHLTFGAMQKYANQGLEGALEGGVGALGGLNGGLNGEIDKKAISAFGKALSDKYGELAGTWLDTDGGKKLTGGLADWVDANPKLIVLIALLAAGGAVLANMDIPTIKQKFKIGGGLTAEIEAELGKLRAIALEEIKVKLQWESGPLVAAVQASHDGEKGGVDVKAEVGVSEKDSYSVKGTAEFTQDGIKAWGANASLNTDAGTVAGSVAGEKDKDPVVKGSLTRKDGTTTTVDEVGYDANTGVFTYKNTKNFLVDSDTNVNVSQGASSDGSSQFGIDASHKINPNLTAKGGFQENTSEKNGVASTTDTFNAGLAYNNDKSGTNWGLDARFGTDGTGSLSGQGSWKPSAGLKLNANAGYDWGPDSSNFKLGGGMAYEDAATRSKFMLNGSYASKDNQFDLNMLGQRNVTDDFALRGQLGLSTGNQGTKYNAGLHGAYFLDKETALIGGMRYQMDEKGQSHFIPEVGAQIKGIPLTIGYDTQNKGFVIGAQISF